MPVRSIAFYKENLSLEPAFSSPEWTEIPLGEGRLCLHGTEEPRDCAKKPVMILSVTGLEKTVAEMKCRGVEFLSGIRQVCEDGYAADFVDPTGQQVSLFEKRSTSN